MGFFFLFVLAINDIILGEEGKSSFVLPLSSPPQVLGV